MKKYFTVSVKLRREDANGKVKVSTERYLVNALSVTESEARVYAHLEAADEKDFKVAASSESRIVEVIEL